MGYCGCNFTSHSVKKNNLYIEYCRDSNNKETLLTGFSPVIEMVGSVAAANTRGTSSVIPQNSFLNYADMVSFPTVLAMVLTSWKSFHFLRSWKDCDDEETMNLGLLVIIVLLFLPHGNWMPSQLHN
jgi:hypothetical protein